MIDLVIDGQCNSCPDFTVEYYKTELGDHIIMCAYRKECYAKRVAAMESMQKHFWVREDSWEDPGR